MQAILQCKIQIAVAELAPTTATVVWYCQVLFNNIWGRYKEIYIQIPDT